MSYTKDEVIVPRDLEEEMKESYLRYSMSVIIARALPDVRDGLKPSQRRILYAMRQLNLSPGGKHRKCAKISGDTSGDYHPHGEQVIYPTLVRLAQDWVMRYSLINGQGNFGSIDGDPPAAMRYTEARLTSASMALMEDLDKETVDMIPNYDETKNEPTVFPAKFPNLLANGSSGIAVGMATNIPPHNLGELISATLLVLADRETTIDEIMKVMPGPDFPTGGVICGYRGIKEAYHTGRGKLMVRALMHVEQKENGREAIVIDEVPYNANKSRLIEQIADLINEKVIGGLSDIRDESDKDGLRIVLELKRGESTELAMNQLYKNSDLQVTFGCNMLALDHGLPRTMNIKHFMTAWIDHRIEVIRRRTRFELMKAEARAHILEGYLKALDHLDEVVKVIRSSTNRDGARSELMERFGLSERQSNAVLDLRLYQLTGMEYEKIDNEFKDLLVKIAHYKAILASEEMVRDIIREELEDVRRIHKSERKTKIVPAEGEFREEDTIANEQVVITISSDNYIKRMSLDHFREQRRGGAGVIGMKMKKENDSLKNIYIASTHDTLLLFTTLGRCYWIKVHKLPDSGRNTKGRPLINLLEGLRESENEKVAAILRVKDFTEDAFILLATRKGVVKKTELAAFTNPRTKGVYALNIDEGDELIAARMTRPTEQVMLFTRGGMAVRFDESQVRSMGRVARGVRGVSLKEGTDDKVIGCEVVTSDQNILVVCENGFGKRSRVDEFRQTQRGGIGVRSIIVSERNGLVVAALSVTDADSVLLMSSSGQAIRIGMDGVRVISRSTQGVQLVDLKDDKDVVVGAQKIEAVAGVEANVEASSTVNLAAEASESELVPEETIVTETEIEAEDEPLA
jgi:DNA gyrase subunit A